MKITYTKALMSLYPNQNFTIQNDDLDNIIWHDNNAPTVSKQNILDEQIRLQEIEDNKPENIKKASGKQKLKDLGLDDDEINALMGV